MTYPLPLALFVNSMTYTHIFVESEWKTFRNNNRTAPKWDRTLIPVLGSPNYCKSSALDHAVTQCVGLLISLPYLNLNSDEQTGIQNMQGLMYLIVTETIFTYTYSVFHTFPQEIPLLLREIGNGLYRPGPYYISKMIILIPRAILGPFIYTGLIFYIAGLQGGVTGFLLFCIPVISSAIAATAYDNN
uniref:ABC-2 type transporter transmembrane domain-containing protein n=1 Tax=Timema monikensis TaxID=170555 RepID=A0A7R9EES1_9NEOP|nr:unnamed protein product [Timema monikensis]